MTSKFSIDNRELLQRISSGDAVVGIDFGNLIVRELAAFRLAAMDSEPVGMFRKSAVGYTPSYHEDAVPLYRHAQPAPVVQCPFPCGWDNLNKLAIQDAELVARGLVEGELTTEAHRQAAISNNDRLLKVISSCRAAMLAAAPQSPGSEPATVPGKWIPVSERMPEKNGTYQVWNGEHVGAVPFLFGSFQCLNPEQVTHWMPTAKPPREVK
ncbi:DUF551 domain-containing protein [Raoultella ornithinolytica]|uniref:DUF551 domain-containing protein n=1 Tax=Raoultella ornithinolytica TaxID=54291 RepID=UPI0029CAB2A6|nr:DUF551 domain-containing protein [Raoultella ornithinolytica]WPJ13391.1 DUF551 domain-containing protein [Raoultella ornithinolytica]